MVRSNFIPFVSMLLAVMVLLVLSMQYPFSSSFPIGGDAPFYARRAQDVLTIFSTPKVSIEALRVAWYPLSLVIFSTSAVLPISWPTRFIWYMAGSHIIVGLILARLLYRISGWRASALVLVIWAITTTGITRHVEDGTLAHLISFIFLALFLERISADASWTALFALIATILTHPINGLALLVTIVIATPILLATWPNLTPVRKKQILIICPTSIVMLFIVVFAGKPVFANAANIIGVANNPFINILVSRFAPFVALSPLGLLILLKSNRFTTLKFILAALFSLSAILAGNDLLGISVWADRLAPLFIFTITIFAAIGLSFIIQTVFSRMSGRMFFVVIFVSLVSVSAWHANMIVFRFYEDPINYARLHPEELAALYWMRDNLSSDSIIIATTKNRHSEWIPVITHYKWLPLAENDEYLISLDGDPNNKPAYSSLEYVAFFTLREIVSTEFAQNPDKYPLVFSNDAVSVYNVPPRKNEI